MLLGKEGEVFSWGRGNWGQTGHADVVNIDTPKRIQALECENIVQVISRFSHLQNISSIS